MGASRDLTAGARTITLERTPAGTTRPATPAASGDLQLDPRVAPHALHPRNLRSTGRLGSKQVVSVRGRRVSDTTDVKRKFSTVTAIAVPLLTLGVLAAMVLSGVSTSQSFTVQQLQARERELSNQVETLNRDLENMRSSSEIARQAADAGMVVPHVPGILSVDGNGAVREDRAFDPEATQKMTEVTAPAGGGEGAREDRATSDREATAQVGDNLTELPGGNVLGQNDPLDPLDPLAPRQAAPEAAAPAAPPAPAENLAPYAPRAAAAR